MCCSAHSENSSRREDDLSPEPPVLELSQPSSFQTEDYDSRTRALLGDQAMTALKNARVAVVGLGGVGGSAALALARCGIGNLTLIDSDVITPSNCNRQVLAYHSTVGKPKAAVAREIAADISPCIKIRAFCERLTDENIETLLEGCSYVIDAVDEMTAKLLMAVWCREKNVYLISSMGTGNKLDASRLRIGDIAQTHTDPLARVMRRELKKRSIEQLPVVWSDETPRNIVIPGANRRAPASVAFVPPAAGLLLAQAVVTKIIDKETAK